MTSGISRTARIVSTLMVLTSSVAAPAAAQHTYCTPDGRAVEWDDALGRPTEVAVVDINAITRCKQVLRYQEREAARRAAAAYRRVGSSGVESNTPPGNGQYLSTDGGDSFRRFGESVGDITDQILRYQAIQARSLEAAAQGDELGYERGWNAGWKAALALQDSLVAQHTRDLREEVFEAGGKGPASCPDMALLCMVITDAHLHSAIRQTEQERALAAMNAYEADLRAEMLEGLGMDVVPECKGYPLDCLVAVAIMYGQRAPDFDPTPLLAGANAE